MGKSKRSKLSQYKLLTSLNRLKNKYKLAFYINQIIAPSPINKTKKIEQAQSFGRKGFMFFLVFKPCELSKFVYLHARVIYIIKITKPFRP